MSIEDKRICILDNTLGNSFELQMNRFGCELIKKTTTALSKSRIEYIEYGVLASFKAGYDAAVFISTALPEYIVKRNTNTQMYSLMLDKNTRPLLKDIPDRTPKTADCIRMIFNSISRKQDIEYFRKLRTKGYEVAIVIEEAWQYEKEDFFRYLYEIRELEPFAVFITDDSGVMNKEEISEKMRTMEEILFHETSIGIQKSGYGKVEIDLMEIIYGYNWSHQCIIVSTLKGVSAAVKHACTEQLAALMNKKRENAYEVLELNYIASKYEGYVNENPSYDTLLMHFNLMKNRCTYKYLDFICRLGIGTEECIEILSKIPKNERCVFSRQTAYRAIFSLYSKQCATVILLFVKDNPKYVLQFLSDSLLDMLFHGFKIVICDASDDDRTEAIALSFIIEYACNLEYRRISNSDTNCDKSKILSFLKECRQYEYVWFVGESLFGNFHSFAPKLYDEVRKKRDWILVCQQKMNSQVTYIKEYSDFMKFFTDNSSYCAITDFQVIRRETLEKALKYDDSNESFYGRFQLIKSMLKYAIECQISSSVILSDVVRFTAWNSTKDFWGKTSFLTWGYDWPKVIMQLPGQYKGIEKKVLRIQTYNFCPMRIKEILKYRANNLIDFKTLAKNKDFLSIYFGKSYRRICVISIIPKKIACFCADRIDRIEKKGKGLAFSILKVMR